jgi:hypothetical protein
MFCSKKTLQIEITREEKLTDLKPNPRGELLRYLGDSMSVSEREAFELRLIEDGGFSDEIEAVEFDLIEDFAAGISPSAERKQIAAWIEASPERSARVLIAQKLHRSSSKRQKNATWILWIPALSACIALATVLLLLRGPQPAPSATSSSTVTSHAPSSPRQNTILLAAERLRGSETTSAATTYPVYPDSSTRLQIMLPPADGGTAYSVILQDNAPDSGPLVHLSRVTPQGDASAPYLELTLLPGALRSGEYTLQLRSRTGNYRLSFKVKVE